MLTDAEKKRARRGNKPTLEQVVKLCVEVYGNPSFLILCGYSEEEALRMMEEYRRKKHENRT